MTIRTLMDFERKGWAKRTCWVNKWIKGATLILWLGLSVLFAYKGWFKEPRIAWLALFGMIYVGVGIPLVPCSLTLRHGFRHDAHHVG
jgi:hypothetical protein